MYLRSIFCAISLVLLLPTISVPTESRSADERLQQFFVASELLRANDPNIRTQGVTMLFDLRGLYAYTTLKYMWLAESNPNVRKAIVKGFKKLGDHVFIADPDFPRDWVVGLKHFEQMERQKRLRELRDYFPKEVARYLEAGS